MRLTLVDWAIIIGYFLLTLAIGLAFSRRAGRSLADYFVSGRSLPWWMAGTSMVATTFAADTPLAVTGLLAKNGLAGNWFWWSFALGGMFTTFLYARLWRRAEVLTDVELVELRYGGRPAELLRGFRAVYLALLVNSIIVGWVTGAMLKVLKVTVLSDTSGTVSGTDWAIIAGMLLVVGIYSTLSGLWGVAVTDCLQFLLAMGGCVALAVLATIHVGGIESLQQRVIENFGGGDQAFRFLPDFWSTEPWMPLQIFLIMLFVQWWATWYPGAEPGGGGFVVQRMASCQDERQATLATLWFQIAHYCVRPWPWLMIGFAALAMYPGLRDMPDPGLGFPMVLRDVAPNGLRGLMLVAFAAAFMSTISTQLNWGASYLINDIYRRFWFPHAGDAHLARAARAASLLVLIVGGAAAWLMRDVSVDDAWKLLAAMGAGTGSVFMLRWFWWRINAWSEISAMAASLVAFLVVRGFVSTPEYQLVVIAGLTIPTWVGITLATPPENTETLLRFYRKVRPGGPGWHPLAIRAPDVQPDRNLGTSLALVAVASGMVYLTLPGVGYLIFGDLLRATLCLAGAVVCGLGVGVLTRSAERQQSAADDQRPDPSAMSGPT